MQKFMNMIRQQASIVNNSITSTSVGQITAYNPANYTVTVELYPQDGNVPALQTGWIPLFTPFIGWYLAPHIGDIVEVHYQDGSLQNAYAGLRSFNFGAPANHSAKSGEFALIHSSGSLISFTNDGKVTLNGDVEIDVTSPVVKITCATSATITAPIINLDSASVNLGTGSLSALMTAAAAAVYNSHTHTGSFSGTTSPPSPQITGDQTTNTKAS